MENEGDFDEFYAGQFQTVFRAAFALSGSRSLAEDATQESFARALERWGRLADAPWKVGWVVTTALNLVRREHRRILPARVYPPPSQVAANPDFDTWELLRSLPVRQQQAIVLRGVLEFSTHDAAAAMGCSEGAVKAHLHRARQKLLRTIRESEER